MRTIKSIVVTSRSQALRLGNAVGRVTWARTGQDISREQFRAQLEGKIAGRWADLVALEAFRAFRKECAIFQSKIRDFTDRIAALVERDESERIEELERLN